ncbi:hypothetical protein FNJ87_16565 [Nonlabens mediterrranea]|uniref:Uncharacterized protein n=1 Tax=Nonlabens mediterrranea TaxID=1419947 RepID=A0ABS0A957_9FLAO|nr:hypothetical protein [Nonlabens mediterrranea]
MTKKILLLFIACAIISCKKDKENINLNVQGVVKTTRLVDDFNCNNTSYVFQIPFYEGDNETQERLNKEIKDLITQDFIDVTYNKDANLEEIWSLFISHREQKICSGDMSGISNINIEHTTQTDAIVSYEITYTRNGQHKRLINTFKKPELSVLKTIDLIKAQKEDDVRTIFDINLQQSVANLALDVKMDDQTEFREFVQNKVFSFKKEDFENATIGINELGVDSLTLQVSKSIALPKTFSYLNSDVKVEIRAKEMEYYLDLSPLKI